MTSWAAIVIILSRKCDGVAGVGGKRGVRWQASGRGRPGQPCLPSRMVARSLAEGVFDPLSLSLKHTRMHTHILTGYSGVTFLKQKAKRDQLWF